MINKKNFPGGGKGSGLDESIWPDQNCKYRWPDCFFSGKSKSGWTGLYKNEMVACANKAQTMDTTLTPKPYMGGTGDM